MLPSYLSRFILPAVQKGPKWKPLGLLSNKLGKGAAGCPARIRIKSMGKVGEGLIQNVTAMGKIQ